MARRGALTALQAVLAGVSGGAQGYVQQREMERKRQQERAAQERQQAMDLITFGERAIEPGPLTTRAPMGVPSAESPRTALPTSAVPLPTGPMDFGGAMRQLEQEEARPSGTTPLRIGDITLNIPIGQRAREIKRSEALMAERGVLDAAIQQAEATGAVEQRLARQATEENQRTAFNELVALGKATGEFRPGQDYVGRLQQSRRLEEARVGRQPTELQLAQLGLDRRRVELAEGRASGADGNIPVAAKNKLAGFNSAVLMSQSIGTLLEENPDALGGAKNFLPVQVTNRLDPQGVDVRAAVEALSGEIRNLRFGGQLTGGELSQAMTMLPDRQDETPAALAKLRQLADFLERKREGIYSAFGGTYAPLGQEQATPARTTSATGASGETGRTSTTVGRRTLPNNPDTF